MLKSKVSLIIIFSLLFLVVLYEGYISGNFFIIPLVVEKLTPCMGNCPSFSLKVELAKDSQRALPGDTIYFTTKIYSLGERETLDYLLRYEILDSSDVIRTFKTETVAIQTQASFVGEIVLPEDLPSGAYSLRILLKTPPKDRTAQTFFTVTNLKEQEQKATIMEKLFSLFYK